MKFLDLNAQYESIRAQIDGAVARVIRESSFILGADLQKLEAEIANYCGVHFAVGLNSGTDALAAALRALQIGPGDEVITTPFSFFATAEVIALVGAKPVFVDIEPTTYNLDSKKIEAAITKKTRALLPVHLYGQPADMDQILQVAQKYKLEVIEDAAQALGAKLHEKHVGSLGKIGCFSFFPSKNLGAYGDGGMLVTDDEAVVSYVRKWRVHGSTEKYHHEFLGVSSRLDNLQAAILLAKFPHLDTWNAKRREVAQRYTTLLSGAPKLITPTVLANSEHTFHQYTVRIEGNKRNEVKERLAAAGVPTMVYYPSPLHAQPALKHLGYANSDFPEAIRASEQVLSLPIYPEIKLPDQEKVATLLREILS